MANNNVALIQSFEDAFISGDMDYILSILDDNITVHESDSVPYPGAFHGKDGFVELAKKMISTWEFTSQLDLDIMPASEDRVVVLVKFDARSKETGKPITIKISEIYTIRNNRIADIQVYYWDTAEIQEAIAA